MHASIQIPSKVKSKSKSKLFYDRRSVDRSVLEPVTNFSPLPWKLPNSSRFCYCGAPFLTRGWVCNLQLLRCFVTAVFFRLSFLRDMRPYFTVSILRPPTGKLCSCIYFPQEQGSPVILSGVGLGHTKLKTRKSRYRI
jgi:hypothetical protein